MKKYQIPFASIAHVKDSRIVWTKAYGFADLETGRRMTTDTLSQVQSISNPVTAWGTMKLIEQRKLHWMNHFHAVTKTDDAIVFLKWATPTTQKFNRPISV